MINMRHLMLSRSRLLLRYTSLSPEAHPCPARRHYKSRASSDINGPSWSYAAKPPKKEQPAWKRLAAMIQDDQNTHSESVYAARLRAAHDPKDHVEKIEEEIMEEMAGALGRTADKCNYKFLLLEREGIKLDRLIASRAGKDGEIEATVSSFNALRKEAEDARRELMIHRQACGFKTGNHQQVQDMWPLPPTRALVTKKGQQQQQQQQQEAVTTGKTAEEIAARQREWMKNMERISRR